MRRWLAVISCLHFSASLTLLMQACRHVSVCGFLFCVACGFKGQCDVMQLAGGRNVSSLDSRERWTDGPVCRSVSPQTGSPLHAGAPLGASVTCASTLKGSWERHRSQGTSDSGHLDLGIAPSAWQPLVQSIPISDATHRRASSAAPEWRPRHSDRSPIHSVIEALMPGTSSPVRPMSRW